MAFSLYEIDGYQDVSKPSDLLGENYYYQDVFNVNRPEIMHYDDNSTQVTDDKREPFFRERNRDEKEDKGDYQKDDQSYIKNVNDWSNRDDYLVKKTNESIKNVIAFYRLENSPSVYYYDYPDHNNRSAKSLADLMRDTSRFSIKRAPNTRVKQLRFDPVGRRYVFKVNGFETWSDSRGHQVVVELGRDPKVKDIRALEVKVSCSCPFWKYYGPDYNSHSEKYLEGDPYSNLKFPSERDPNRKNKLCKHVFAVGEQIREYVVKQKLDTYRDVDKIFKTLEDVKKVLGMDNTINGIKDIVSQLKNTESKELERYLKQYKTLKNENQKQTLFSKIIEELKNQLDIKDRSFLLRINSDLKNFFNMIKRQIDREEKQKKLVEERDKKKKQEKDKKDNKKQKAPSTRRKLRKLIKKKSSNSIHKILDLYIKETGDFYGQL